MSVVRLFDKRFGSDRYIVGKEGSRIGEAVLLTRLTLEQVVREGAAALGWQVVEPPKEKSK